MTGLSLLLLTLSPYWMPAATWAILTTFGLGSLLVLTGTCEKDPVLQRIIASSFLLRTSVGLVLFSLSYHQVPILESLQLSDGFWKFGGDAVGYHEHSLRILRAWENGTDLQSEFEISDNPYSLYRDLSVPLAFTYKLFGISPIHFIIVNAYIWSLGVLLSYRVVRRLSTRYQNARITAFLIAFWPSTLIWTGQLLKDTFATVLIITALSAATYLWKRRLPSSVSSMAPHVSLLSLLFVCILAASYLRFYVGYVFIATFSLGFGISVILRVFWEKGRPLVTPLAVTLVTTAGLTTAHSVDWLATFSPEEPERGYTELAYSHLQNGELDNAIASSERALIFNLDYIEARQLIATVLPDYEQPVYIPDTLNAQSGLLLIPPSDPSPASTIIATPLPVSESSTPPLAPAHPEAVVTNSAVPSTTPVARQRPATAPYPHQTTTWGNFTNKLFKNTSDRLKLASNVVLGYAKKIMSPAGVHRLNVLRQGMINTGGHSLVDAHVSFASGSDVVAYVPRALMLAFLSPTPSQWTSASGGTGVFRRIALVEVLLLYILLPCILFSIFRVLQKSGEQGALILLFAAIMATILGLIIANVGILFRLRLQALIPILIIIGLGGVPGFYKRSFTRIWRIFF